MVFTQRKDHLGFVDAQRNPTLQLRADFSCSPFLPWLWSCFCACARQAGRGCWASKAMDEGEKCPKENSLNAFAVLGAVNLPGMVLITL